MRIESSGQFHEVRRVGGAMPTSWEESVSATSEKQPRVTRPVVALRENESRSDRFATIDSTEIFKQFVTAINSHDVKTLTSLMTADHAFVDSVGNRVHGATSMEAGWRGYFAMCPDYRIQTDDLMAKGGAAICGEGHDAPQPEVGVLDVSGC